VIRFGLILLYWENYNFSNNIPFLGHLLCDDPLYYSRDTYYQSPRDNRQR